MMGDLLPLVASSSLCMILIFSSESLSKVLARSFFFTLAHLIVKKIDVNVQTFSKFYLL